MSKNRIDITEQEAIDLKENITEEEKDLLNNDLWKRNSEIFPGQMETEYFPNGSSGNKGEEVKTKCIFGYTQFKTV